MIFISCLNLVVETYTEGKIEEDISTGFMYFDYFLTAIFSIEAILKIVAKGFILDKGSYLKDVGNRIDFFIVIESLLDIIFSSSNGGVFRVLRALRPLRILPKFRQMRIVIKSLSNALGPLINVGVLMLMTWVIFAILGMSLMAERMNHCDVGEEGSAYGISMAACLQNGKKWTHSHWNFDNVFEALVTLFLVSTLESWQHAVFSSVDIGPDTTSGPMYNYSPWFLMYFIAFLLISSFFLMDLISGIIFYKYGEELDNQISNSTQSCSEDQSRWIMVQSLIQSSSSNFDLHRIPKNKCKRLIFRLITHPLFSIFMSLTVLANAVILCLEYESQSDSYSFSLYIGNSIITVIFIFEVLIKLIVLGKDYFISFWNNVDAVISIACLIDFTFTTFAFGYLMPTNVVKAFRILRLTRLVSVFKSKYMEGFIKLIDTLIFSLPPLFNVYVLLLLNLFIFSVIGAFLFKEIPFHAEFNNEVWSFRNFHLALFTLFRCATGEEWPFIMFTYGEEPGYYVVSRIFFLCYAAITELIVLNLLKLVVVEIFQNFYFNPESAINMMQHYGKIFNRTWNAFTIKEKGKKIFFLNLPQFFAHLE